MAINLANKYPGRANPESVDYPSGSFKNRTTPDSKDGMILEQSWANDFLGARDAILSEAGIVADGEVETAQKSQVLEALNKLYKALSTTDAAGIIQLATAAEAQELVNAAKAITPKTLDDAFKGSNQLLAGNGYQKIKGGLIIQWGSFTASYNSSSVTNLDGILFPISFPVAAVSISVQKMSGVSHGSGVSDAVVNLGVSSFGYRISTSGIAYTNIGFRYIVIGY